MPNVTCVYVSDVIRNLWVPDLDTLWNGKYVPEINQDYNDLDKEGTYMIVFGPSQDEHMLMFEGLQNINILFKSKKAVNKRPAHGKTPRNTLFIFEMK